VGRHYRTDHRRTAVVGLTLLVDVRMSRAERVENIHDNSASEHDQTWFGHTT
jgi:hypothetical protein